MAVPVPYFFRGLVILWILWVLPSALRRSRAKGERRAKTAPVSLFGMLLQSAAYPFVWLGRPDWSHTLHLWHVLTSFVLGVISLVLIWSAIPALGKQWRIKAGVYEDHVLVRSGPYRFVRHPIYSSMLALLLATAALRSSPFQLFLALILFVSVTEIRIRSEERLLAERFGAEFDAYKAATPAYVPFLR